MHSSAAARPTSGCEPAPRPSVTCAPSWISRSALVMVSACASVLATTNSTPRSPAVIMLLTALPPPPPTPKTVMRGLSSVISGFCRLIAIVLVLFPFVCRIAAAAAFGAIPVLLETIPQPLTHPGEPPARSGHALAERPCREALLETRHLGVDHQPDHSREGRPLGRLRQASHAERPADAHAAPQNAARRLRQADKLAGAAG